MGGGHSLFALCHDIAKEERKIHLWSKTKSDDDNIERNHLTKT